MDYKLVKNEEKYFEFIRELRNDPDNLPGFLEQNYITQEQQQKYMSKHKNHYYICLYNSEPVGFIGIVDNDLRLAVISSMHNKGIGSFMIQEISKVHRDFNVQIKANNIASINAFKKNGFIESLKNDKSNLGLIIMTKG